jgi:hypothetical protein
MQLELLPSTTKSPQHPRVWDRLSQEQRTKLTAALVRLIRKAVLAEPREDHDER